MPVQGHEVFDQQLTLYHDALISVMPPSLITNHQPSVRPIKQTPMVERHPTSASLKACWRARVTVHTRGKVGSFKYVYTVLVLI